MMVTATIFSDDSLENDGDNTSCNSFDDCRNEKAFPKTVCAKYGDSLHQTIHNQCIFETLACETTGGKKWSFVHKGDCTKDEIAEDSVVPPKEHKKLKKIYYFWMVNFHFTESHFPQTFFLNSHFLEFPFFQNPVFQRFYFLEIQFSRNIIHVYPKSLFAKIKLETKIVSQVHFFSSMQTLERVGKVLVN